MHKDKQFITKSKTIQYTNINKAVLNINNTVHNINNTVHNINNTVHKHKQYSTQT